MVVASNFLCHMAPGDSEKCLRNMAKLVSPGGYLFVSGVDLDVRTKVALDLGWEAVPELIAEIHEGDPSVRGDWPWQWWGLEPLNRKGTIGKPVMRRRFGLTAAKKIDLRSTAAFEQSAKLGVRCWF